MKCCVYRLYYIFSSFYKIRINKNYIITSHFFFKSYFSACALEPTLKPEGRIIGGIPADITEAPYQVGLLLDVFEVGLVYLACGGSLITESVVISTASCPEG